MKIRILQRKSNEFKLQRRVLGIWFDCHNNGELVRNTGYRPFISNHSTARAYKLSLEHNDTDVPKWRVVVE